MEIENEGKDKNCEKMNSWYCGLMKEILGENTDDYLAKYRQSIRGNEYILKSVNENQTVTMICSNLGSGCQIEVESDTFQLYSIKCKMVNNEGDESVKLINYLTLLGKKYKLLCDCVYRHHHDMGLTRREVLMIINDE